jgi:hypothetical protein
VNQLIVSESLLLLSIDQQRSVWVASNTKINDIIGYFKKFFLSNPTLLKKQQYYYQTPIKKLLQ